MKKAVFLLTAILVATFLVSPGLAAEKEVVIGAIYPLSGGAAPAGADVKNGAELAVEIINGKYDLSLPLIINRW